jgi:aryl-alcohol dehydrogenase-like predicted oxidoreductase
MLLRDIERDILPCCEDQGVGVIVWSPLAAGMLSGKYERAPEPPADTRLGQPRPDKGRYWNERCFIIVDRLKELAKGAGTTPAKMALSWALQDLRISALIIGATKVKQLEESLEVGDWDLSDEAWAELEAISRPDYGYPQSWEDITEPMLYGDTEW